MHVEVPARQYRPKREWMKVATWKGIAFVAGEWLVLLAMFLFVGQTSNPTLIFFATVFSGTRFYALYSLLHEGIHGHLHPNKDWNDRLSKYLVALPLLVDFEKMREAHLAHHRHLGSAADPEVAHLQYPEFRFPLSKWKFVWISLKDLSGFNFIQYKLRKILQVILGKQSLKKGVLLRFFFLASIFLLSLKTSLWKPVLLVWLIPLATIYQWLNRVRLYSEHMNLPENSTIKTRTLSIPTWQSLLFAPHGLGYHAEHHAFPAVPFYNLGKVHASYRSAEEYSLEVKEEKNYFKMISSLLKDE